MASFLILNGHGFVTVRWNHQNLHLIVKLNVHLTMKTMRLKKLVRAKKFMDLESEKVKLKQNQTH